MSISGTNHVVLHVGLPVDVVTHRTLMIEH